MCMSACKYVYECFIQLPDAFPRVYSSPKLWDHLCVLCVLCVVDLQRPIVCVYIYIYIYIYMREPWVYVCVCVCVLFYSLKCLLTVSSSPRFARSSSKSTYQRECYSIGARTYTQTCVNTYNNIFTNAHTHIRAHLYIHIYVLMYTYA